MNRSFKNAKTVQFDNPLRSTDIPGGRSRGQAVMWPANSLVSLLVNDIADRNRSRVTGIPTPVALLNLTGSISTGHDTYVYSLAPNSAVFVAPAAPRQLAPLKNRLSGGRAEVQLFIRPNVALGAVHWYEQYRVEGFALNPTMINALSIGTAAIYSEYLYRPCTTHTGWSKITYLW